MKISDNSKFKIQNSKSTILPEFIHQSSSPLTTHNSQLRNCGI
jgi:hypothetical protein